MQQPIVVINSSLNVLLGLTRNAETGSKTTVTLNIPMCHGLAVTRSISTGKHAMPISKKSIRQRWLCGRIHDLVKSIPQIGYVSNDLSSHQIKISHNPATLRRFRRH
jgi:hypothetical protein